MRSPPHRDHQLRLFIAVAKAHSLREAADVLEVTQPALSKQIRALEQSLGRQLFIRHGRGMQLSAEGRALFERVEPLIEGLDGALAATRVDDHDARGPTGTLRVAAVQTLIPLYLPRWSAALEAVAPRVLVSFHCPSSAEVVEAIERDRADIGFVYDAAVDAPDLVLERIHDEGMAIYGRRSPPAGVDLMSFLRTQRLVLPPRQFALRRMVERAIGHASVNTLECDSMELSLRLVAGHDLFTVLPDDLPTDLVEGRGIVRCLLTSLPRRPIVALTKRRLHGNALVELGVRIARDIRRVQP